MEFKPPPGPIKTDLSGYPRGGFRDILGRREFLARAGRAFFCMALTGLGWNLPAPQPSGREPPHSPAGTGLPRGDHEALHYESLEGDRVRCRLCFRGCVIPSGGRGHCGVRENRNGRLYTLVYGHMAVVTTGAVEKKPLHHYLPGARAYNLGTAGCNLNCRFCHNWHLSQRTLEEVGRYRSLTPEDAVREALDRGVRLVSFTYNEPTVFYEFMLDTARIARDEGLGVNVNTNAMLEGEPLEELLKYADSFTVDLKGYSEDFYSEVCAGSLEPVLENLETMKDSGVWIEVVNLVIPGLNDDPGLIRGMCKWHHERLGPDVPLHFSRFSPSYRLRDLEPTPVSVLEMARKIARKAGLRYISIGNVPGHPHNSTHCPGCGEVIVERHHFTVRRVRVEQGKCSLCGYRIPGVWD